MATESAPGASPADKTDTAASDDGADQPPESDSTASHIITYACGHGAEHAIPSDDVRVMAWGATGFEVACTCGPEPLAEADEPPHDSVDHIASIEGAAPSPEEWLALETARDGWFHENPWRLVKSEGKTPMELRATIRDGMEDIADDNSRNSRGGADETDEAARAVPCPYCGATAGTKCQRPSGHRVRRSHAARKDDAGVGEGGDDSDTTDQATLEVW